MNKNQFGEIYRVAKDLESRIGLFNMAHEPTHAEHFWLDLINKTVCEIEIDNEEKTHSEGCQYCGCLFQFTDPGGTCPDCRHSDLMCPVKNCPCKEKK